jgi:hypothetical protein
MAISNTILDVQELIAAGTDINYGMRFYTVTLQIDFPPNEPYPGDWIRDDVSFLIGPNFGPTSSLSYIGSIVMAVPATFEVLPSRNPELGLIGWGVDTASTALDPTNQVRVTARVVGKASASYFDRLRFLVIISTGLM